MLSVAVVTIITKSHLPYARVLMGSVGRWAPQVRRFAILADRIDGAFEPSFEDFEILTLDSLNIQDRPWFYFKYSAMELNMALKPAAIQFLFERHRFDAVIYFDADIKIYQALEPLLEQLNGRSLILTPHLTSPVCDGFRPSDWDILRAGIYNGGFLMVRKCEEGGRFLNWWNSRLQDHCLIDYPNGLFVDQRWLDFVPSFFPAALILREPGCNVAYWNLGERHIERTGSRWMVNGKPLYFAHFSGLDPERPGGVSRHQNRHNLSSLGEGERALFLDYANEVMDRGYKESTNWPYAYGFFDNGIAISDLARRAFYESAEISKSIQDPFSEAGYRALIQFWNDATGASGAPRVTDLGYSGGGSRFRQIEAGESLTSTERPLPRLAWTIYKSRPDVQSAFPDPLAADRLRFLTWLLSAGAVEHGIGREFLGPLWREWEAALSGLSAIARVRQRSLRWAMAAWKHAR